jgi:hypothetical protein
MMKYAFAAFAGLLGVANAQTCDNVEEYTVSAGPFVHAAGLDRSTVLRHVLSWKCPSPPLDPPSPPRLPCTGILTVYLFFAL